MYSQICTGSYVQLYTSNYRCVDIYVQLYMYRYVCTVIHVHISLYRCITASTYLNTWLNAIRTALAWRNVKGECVPAQTCQNKLLIRHFANSTAIWNAWIVTEWVCDRILRCKEISISKERHSKHNAVDTYNSHTRPPDGLGYLLTATTQPAPRRLKQNPRFPTERCQFVKSLLVGFRGPLDRKNRLVTRRWSTYFESFRKQTVLVPLLQIYYFHNEQEVTLHLLICDALVTWRHRVWKLKVVITVRRTTGTQQQQQPYRSRTSANSTYILRQRTSQ